MIYANKITMKKVKMKANDIFKRTGRTLQGHDFKIQNKKATKLPTINVFSNRIVNDWNTLPKDCVSNDDKWFQKRVRQMLERRDVPKCHS